MLKSVWEWMIALALILRSTCHVLIHGENCLLFNEVWPRWGVCLCVCVLLCKCVSDAANCPFAVYPMGSGMPLVTACSFSLNGPVAMAAPQRPAPPPQRNESDRPIRAGRCDMQSAVITALRREEPGRGHHTPAGSQQDPSPNKHDEPGPWRSCVLPERDNLIPPLHVAVSCDTSGESSTNYTTQRASGTYQTLTGWLSCVILCWRSSSPVTLSTYCFAIILSSLHPLGKACDNSVKYKSWRRSRRVRKIF